MPERIQRMKVACLGCGSIGRRHIRNLKQMASVELMAFDPSPEAREALLRESLVPVAATLEQVWEWQPALTFIASPSILHVELSLAAARQGSDLFVEKPLSHSLEGVDQLTSEVQQRQLISMVGCNMRFHPGPRQVRRWLQEGVVGEVLSARFWCGSYLPRWRPRQDYRHSYSASPESGGAILDCIHELDLALWLLGAAEVRAAVRQPATSLGLQTDGLAETILVHRSGAISSVHLNFVQRNYDRGIRVIGSEGTIGWEFDGQCGRVELYGPDGTLQERIEQPADWENNQMYVDEIRYLLDCVEQRQPPFNSLDVAAETLRVALQARAL